METLWSDRCPHHSIKPVSNQSSCSESEATVCVTGGGVEAVWTVAHGGGVAAAPGGRLTMIVTVTSMG
jgi:hypothetical protein